MYEHQKVTTEFLLRNKRAFVLNEMGTGKTLSVLWACDILFKAGRIKKVCIISPISTMKSVWAKEIFENMPWRSYFIAHGHAALRTQGIKADVSFVIMNHDGVKFSMAELIQENFDIFIIDETTAYKTHSSARTKAMMIVANRAKAVWGLTGEPTPNSPLEAYSQAKIINPANPLLPRFYTHYKEATMLQINAYMWVPKEGSEHMVAAILQPAVRYLRKDCLDLPPTFEQDFEIDFTKEQAYHYDNMKREAYTLHERGEISASNAAVVLNKLLQISSGSVKTNDQDVVDIDYSPRFERLIEIFEETPQKKLVIFAAYIATIRRLADELRSKGIRAATIYGDVDKDSRAEHIENFQNGDLQVLVMQPRTSAHGITLVAASTVVWFSLVPSNELYQQGNARIIRAGQVRNTHIIRLLSSPAEKHIAKILSDKAHMSSAVLGLFDNRHL